MEVGGQSGDSCTWPGGERTSLAVVVDMAEAERSENHELSLVGVGEGRTRAISRMSPGVLVHTAGQRVVPHAEMGTPESHPHSRMEAGFYQGQDPSSTGTTGPETEVRVLWTPVWK